MMKKVFIQKIFTALLFVVVSVGASFPVQDVNAAGSGLVPCGSGTGNTSPCTLCHLVQGVDNIIQWGMQVMTYFGIAVIVAMGIVYIVSAGNPAMMTTAKNGIKSSLIGFALMLGAWIIINTIMTTLANNGVGHAENWYSFTCDTASSTNQSNQTSLGNGTGDSSTGKGGTLSCTNKCASDPAISNAVKNNSSNVNPNLLMSIVAGGEGCNKRVSSDGFGSCGYSQALPKIRKWCGITGDSCSVIQNDVQVDMNCAAKLIADNAKRCGGLTSVSGAAACYNSGGTNCSKTTNNYCGRVNNYYNSCQ